LVLDFEGGVGWDGDGGDGELDLHRGGDDLADKISVVGLDAVDDGVGSEVEKLADEIGAFVFDSYGLPDVGHAQVCDGRDVTRFVELVRGDSVAGFIRDDVLVAVLIVGRPELSEVDGSGGDDGPALVDDADGLPVSDAGHGWVLSVALSA
jgi:hypothetical protein